MKLNKNDIYATIGTTIVMVLLWLFLIFFGYTSIVPQEEEGLTVNFGNVDLSAGQYEPYAETTAENQTPAPTPAPSAVAETPSQEELITQEEESVDLQAAQKKKEEEARLQAEAKRKAEEEAKRAEEERIRKEKERKASEIQNQVANVFGSARGSNENNQGEGTNAQGNQGIKEGSTESANIVGKGSGYGDFSLAGRSAMGALPRPNYDIVSEGVVVIRITVNSKGSVIATSIDLQGTDTDNVSLRNAALEAAKQAKFNAIEGTQNQTGTITYRFRLK